MLNTPDSEFFIEIRILPQFQVFYYCYQFRDSKTHFTSKVFGTKIVKVKLVDAPNGHGKCSGGSFRNHLYWWSLGLSKSDRECGPSAITDYFYEGNSSENILPRFLGKIPS